ncbi:uncharacterized protein [Panulirus ornatus]|uniref:uncharacterized protein isoform X1 n=1 Tax=Panulirus ornatus TaxID=150431 RepID=UPI003A86DA86
MTIDVLVNPASVVRPLKPIWYATVQLSIPLGDRDTGDLEMAMAMVLIFRLQIRLYEVFNRDSRRGRSIQEDQLELFRQIEDNIATMGVDGHACVLRFICEMQTNRFSRSSIFGEIFTLIFTPKQGDDYSLLKDYIAAEMAGQEADTPSGSAGPICVERYPSCPMSVFAALRRFQSGLGYSTPADRPGNATIHMDDHTLTLDDEV